MTQILRAIFTLVVWAFVPSMLSVVLFRAYAFADRIEHKRYQAAVKAGFWGGCMTFLIILLTEVGVYVRSGFPDKAIYQGFNVFLALAAALGTFALISGKRTMPAKLAGWLVLGLTAVSLWALVHYLFIHTANKYILSVALGAALGVFAHTAFSPPSRETA